ARLIAIRGTAQRTIECQIVRRLLEIRGNRLTRERMKIREGGVPPPHRFLLLDAEKVLDVGETVGVDRALHRIPGSAHRAHRVDTSVVVEHELVPQRATTLELLIPAHSVEPEQ